MSIQKSRKKKTSRILPKFKGRLITFEGTEGSGKSTLQKAVAAALASRGLSVVQTREPGGNLLSEKIRALVLDPSISPKMHPITELCLYEAARTEHAALTLLPALQAGKWVLCDRFIDSTLAYQASARGLPWKTVKQLNHVAALGIKPHLTVFLDIDPARGLQRAQDPNRFEAEGVQFQEKVRKGFLKARAEAPKRWFTLKIKDQTPEQLAARVVQEIEERFF